jgi:hypothetical protein
MAEKKGKYEFDDKIKEGAKKVGEEIKETGGTSRKDFRHWRKDKEETEEIVHRIGVRIPPFLSFILLDISVTLF